MWIELNFKAGKPPYLQIVDQVKYQVASGAFRAGEALPSIRSLAESLELNRNTVAKAYAELEHEGVIETRQGKGAFVSAEPSPFGKRARRTASSPRSSTPRSCRPTTSRYRGRTFAS